MSFEEIMAEGTQISRLSNDPIYKKHLEAHVSKLITQSYLLSPKGKPAPPEAIPLIAERIISEYWGLKIEEYDVIFNNGTLGKYGSSYDTFGLDVVSNWFLKYQSSEAVISWSENQAARYKSDEHRGRNIDALTTPGLIEKVLGNIPPAEETRSKPKGPEDTEQIALVRKQAETIMKQNPPAK